MVKARFVSSSAAEDNAGGAEADLVLHLYLGDPHCTYIEEYLIRSRIKLYRPDLTIRKKLARL